MSFEVTVTPTVYDVEVEVNPSVQPFDVEVTVGNVPDLDLTTNGDSGASTFDSLTGELNIPNYTLDGLGGVPETRTITINGTTQDLSQNISFSVSGGGSSVTIGSPANGLAIDGNQVLTIGLASGSQTGALSSTDWTTFNNKQNALGYTPENVANKAINFTSPDDTKYPTTLAVSTALAGKQDALTNPITGTGSSGQLAFWNGTTTIGGDSGLTITSGTNSILNLTGRLNLQGYGSSVFIGAGSGLNATSQTQNTAVGINAMSGILSSAFNSAFGGEALFSVTSGGVNSAFGQGSLRYLTSGVGNVGNGRASGFNYNGSNSVFIGEASGLNITSGDNNLIIGRVASRYYSGGTTNATSFSNGIYLGTNTKVGGAGSTNEIVIGYQAEGLGSNTTVIGNSSTTFGRWWGRLLIGTSTDAGYQLDVNGTARVHGAITTGAPTGGTAKPFKIGAVATVTPTSPNRTIEIEIDGTTYYLTAKTTND